MLGADRFDLLKATNLAGYYPVTREKNATRQRPARLWIIRNRQMSSQIAGLARPPIAILSA